MVFDNYHPCRERATAASTTATPHHISRWHTINEDGMPSEWTMTIACMSRVRSDAGFTILHSEHTSKRSNGQPWKTSGISHEDKPNQILWTGQKSNSLRWCRRQWFYSMRLHSWRDGRHDNANTRLPHQLWTMFGNHSILSINLEKVTTMIKHYRYAFRNVKTRKLILHPEKFYMWGLGPRLLYVNEAGETFIRAFKIKSICTW